MGTKNDPGKWDCYAKLEPDEPHFVLMGRDPVAGVLVRFWVELRRASVPSGRSDEEEEKLDEALACSDAMTRWAIELGKEEQVNRALDALARREDPMRDLFEGLSGKMSESLADYSKAQERQAAASERHAAAMERIAGALDGAVGAFVKGFAEKFVEELRKGSKP